MIDREGGTALTLRGSQDAATATGKFAGRSRASTVATTKGN